MRFLVDQAVSWEVARELAAAGHDALHVRDIGLSAADDATILNRAGDEQRVLITQDADFGTLLTESGAQCPSIILLRLRDGRPQTHARMLVANVPALEKELLEGTIVVITEGAVRIRRLPVV